MNNKASEADMSQDEYRAQCLKWAREDWGSARKKENVPYALGYIENMRTYLLLAGNSPPEAIGISEEEVETFCSTITGTEKNT